MAAIALAFVSIGVGVCKCHKTPQAVTGIIINGAGGHTVEGSDVAILGLSMVLCDCGHICPIVSTSKLDNTTEGVPKAEVTSLFSACATGIIITGSPTAS